MTDAAFWDRIAPKYAKSAISDQDAYETGLKRTQSHLKAGDTVLELGCGTGSTALLMRPHVSTYVASDISPGMIQIARGKVGAEGVDFRVAGVRAEDYADLSLDAVLGYNLFHLVPDLDAALSEVHAMLPKGGRFISKTPALGKRWYLRPLIKALQLVGKAPHVNLFTVEELDQAITRAGFRIVETGLYPPKTPSRFVVAEKV